MQLQNREVGIAGAGKGVAAAHRGHDRGGAPGLQASDPHQIGVVEVVAGVVVKEVARQQQAQLGQPAGRLGADPGNLGEGGIGIEIPDGPSLSAWLAGWHQPQPGWGHGQHGAMGLAEGMQALPALAHERLASGEGELVIAEETLAQGKHPLQLRRRQPLGPLLQLLGQEGTEAALPPLEVGEAPGGLQPQRLLQGLQPGL